MRPPTGLISGANTKSRCSVPLIDCQYWFSPPVLEQPPEDFVVVLDRPFLASHEGEGHPQALVDDLGATGSTQRIETDAGLAAGVGGAERDHRAAAEGVAEQSEAVDVEALGERGGSSAPVDVLELVDHEIEVGGHRLDEPVAGFEEGGGSDLVLVGEGIRGRPGPRGRRGRPSSPRRRCGRSSPPRIPQRQGFLPG